jgi:hypothetical protein
MAAKKTQAKKKLPGQIPSEIIEKIVLDHENAIEDRMGHLYNRFVGYIAEARLPIPQVITVLNMLLKDSLVIADKKYKGGE